MSDFCYARIAVNVPLSNSVFTYKFDERKFKSLDYGTLVKVPFKRRSEYGFLLSKDHELSEDLKNKKIKFKEIESVSTLDFSIKESLPFYEKIARYYHNPLGKFLFDILPKVESKKLLKADKCYVKRLDRGVRPIELSISQEKIYKDILVHLKKGLQKFYLNGVTGSGKSHIYLKLVNKILGQGQKVLILVPEIGLTFSVLNFLQEYIDAKIIIYHGSLSSNKKYSIWNEVQRNEKSSRVVILGTRSAIFLPVKNLGLIIVDEEHDQSYKQDTRFVYSGRDAALLKSRIENIPILLSSATPDLSTYYKFKCDEKNATVYSLKDRFGAGELPKVEIVSADTSLSSENKYWPFFLKTIATLKECLKKEKKAIVFINKLGQASSVKCRSCGHEFKCHKCDFSLRYFKKRNMLKCTFCQVTKSYPQMCPECSCVFMQELGYGTEKVQSLLSGLFPEAAIERFDRDELTTTKKLEKKIKQVEECNYDILVGTQMLSKGFNFKDVAFITVLGIDHLLLYPDFWSTERTYQLITQVLGRAGRFEKGTKVYIQTNNPDNPLFKYIAKHDYLDFFNNEIQSRKDVLAPPFSHIIMMYFEGKMEAKVIKSATMAKNFIERRLFQTFKKVHVLGPRPNTIVRKNEIYSWSLMLQTADNRVGLHNMISTLEVHFKALSGVKIKFDVDPISFC